MKLFKEDNEVEAEKDQVQLLLNDGWYKDPVEKELENSESEKDENSTEGDSDSDDTKGNTETGQAVSKKLRPLKK
jgi:hypothetical protein